jgi:hypothetical protein
VPASWTECTKVVRVRLVTRKQKLDQCLLLSNYLQDLSYWAKGQVRK